MIERHLIPALDFWAAQPLDERKKILEALKADVAMADHDFAGLPPQVWAGIAAGLIPPGETSGRPQDEEEPESKSKKGHK